MLAGRHQERRALEALLAGARLGRSGSLVLSGEPGIGKTTLLRHAREQAGGFLVLRATGTESERDLAFAGLSELLAPLADLDGLPAPQRRALAVALAREPGATPDRFAVGAGLLTLLTQVGEGVPVLVLVDDAHLLDRSTSDALWFAARRLLADSVAIVAAARPEGPAPWVAAGIVECPVTGLDDADCAALAEQVAGRPLPAGHRDQVLAWSRGNPLAVRELARQPDLAATMLPSTPPPVSSLLLETFGRQARTLSAQEQRALALAAITDGDLAVVERVLAARGEDLSLLAGAEARGLVTMAGGRVSFAHPLQRAVAGSALAPAELRALHAAVAEALPLAAGDLRARHLAVAAVGPDEAVAAQVEEVARRADRRAAYAEASAAYERAAQLSDSAADRARRRFAAGESAWRSGRAGTATALLEAAVHEEPTGPVAARGEALLGVIAAKAGSLRTARDLLFRAAGRPGVSAQEAVLRYADVVDVSLYRLDTEAATRAAALSEKVVDRVDARTAAIAGVAGGMAAVFAGRPATDRLRHGMAVLAAGPSRVRDDHAAWDLLGPLFLREAGTGLNLVRRAESRLREEVDLGALPHLLFHVARYQATSDAWPQAAIRYTEAVDLARETGQSTELAMNLAGLAWLRGRQGQEGACRLLAAEAAQIALEQDVRLARAWTLFLLAELDLAQGDVEAARAQFQSLDSWLDELGVRDVDLSPAPELVECLVRLGRDHEARPRAAAYTRAATAKQQPWALARARRAQALVADDDAAPVLFEEAVALHGESPDRFEEARTRLAFGERLRRLRSRAEAREQLRQAQHLLDGLGATWWSDRARTELAATGLTVRRRSAGPITDLTGRELQIALLLAEGRTTREAAAALFLSPKTVEYHLRNVYSKLAVSSRAELSRAVADLRAE